MKDTYRLQRIWFNKYQELSVRTVDILAYHGIETITELATYKREDIARYRGCGRRTMEQLDNLLIRHDLWWGQSKETPARQLAEALKEAEAAVRKLSAIIEELNLQIEE